MRELKPKGGESSAQLSNATQPGFGCGLTKPGERSLQFNTWHGMTASELSVAFFLQMFCILAACRLVGAAAQKLGQPQVVGEMIAGVFMGPSLLGLISPGLQDHLFPKESLKVLFVAAQFGVGLYMFLVGTEFDLGFFRDRIRSAASVSMAGMVVPFLLGGLLAIPLLKVPGAFLGEGESL